MPTLGADGRTYEQVVEARDKLAETDFKLGEAYDKHLLTLASGALGLTLLFVEKIASDPSWKFFLVASWVTFAACILSCLIAMHLSQLAIRREAEINEDSFQYPPSEYDGDNAYIPIVMNLNRAALVLFILGVALFILFAALNQRGNVFL